MASKDSPLTRFYSKNDGKTIRRLPSWIVPENAFSGFGVDNAVKALQKRKLDTPQDISLICIDDVWYGTFQVKSSNEAIPPQLMEITEHWVKLCGVSPDITPTFNN